MGFKRVMLEIGKSFRSARAGDGILNPVVNVNTSDAAQTMTAAWIAGGYIAATTALGADRIYTTDTGPNLADAFPEMDLGDSLPFIINNLGTGAFDIIMAGGAGVTLIPSSGNILNQTSHMALLVMTGNTDGAETFDLY